MRKSARLTMKRQNYESPLKCLQSKRRQFEEPFGQRTTKRQKLNSQRRSSVIILNDENDFGKKLGMKKPRREDLADDSVIIIDDLNESFVKNSSQTEDITVVWSSVPESAPKESEILPFGVNKTPKMTNLKMLRGDYPRKWLGDWIAEGKKNVRKSILTARKHKRRLSLKSSLTQIPNEDKNESVQKRVKKILKAAKKVKRIGKKSTPVEKIHDKTLEIDDSVEEKSEEKVKKPESTGKLREIIIDGPNVAKAYTNGKFFSENGLKIVIDYFKDKGHTVKAFVPQHVRNRNRQVLEELGRDGFIVFTPSRKAGSKVITPYDDRYILEYANKCDGIIISNDQFKDLYEEKPEWRDTIENRILPPTFVGDHLMFPEDPLGRKGPKLDSFLRHDS